MAKVEQLKGEYGFFHSVFSGERAPELKLALPQGLAAIVGWGQDKKLLSLACLALNALEGRRIIGVAAKQSGLYHYPSPTLQSGKDAWLEAIRDRIDSAWS